MYFGVKQYIVIISNNIVLPRKVYHKFAFHFISYNNNILRGNQMISGHTIKISLYIRQTNKLKTGPAFSSFSIFFLFNFI